MTLGTENQVWVTAPEDQILRKIDWYRFGGMKSDRQWRDVVGILTVQGDGLDLDDLRETARTLGLDELLNAALDEAELG